MRDLVRDLVDHNGYANAAMLGAIRQHDAAVADRQLLGLLRHILLANRFWLLTVLGERFDLEQESPPSDAFDTLAQRFAATHERQSGWLASATEGDLTRVLKSDQIPGGQCSVGHAFVQVCLHSQGHRAQCAKLLRQHGGAPPMTDFILWLATQ